jgi:hypothetical protein
MPSELHRQVTGGAPRASIPVRATSSCARLVRKLDVSGGGAGHAARGAEKARTPLVGSVGGFV